MSSIRSLLFAASSFATILTFIACGGSPADEEKPADPTSRQVATDEELIEPLPRDPPTTKKSEIIEAGADAPGLECNTLKRDACVTCCNVAYPQLASGFKQSLAQCVCLDPGECRSECGDNYCKGGAASAACAACVENSTICGPATLTVCKSSPACSAYLSCLGTCGS